MLTVVLCVSIASHPTVDDNMTSVNHPEAQHKVDEHPELGHEQIIQRTETQEEDVSNIDESRLSSTYCSRSASMT